MLPKIFTAAICLPLCLALPAFAVKERVELITTDRADFAAGGVIHIEGSTGELNIVGWDQPSVEVMTTRYTFQEERYKQKAADKLKRIEVVKMVSGKGELTISTMRKHERGTHIDYQIMVPRDSRLVIRHHIGDVVVTDVGGDIDAKAGTGDIVVQLPDMEHYAIDAKVRFGTVYSDFDSPRHQRAVGEKLLQADAANGDDKGPAHKIDLHVDTGGISIQKRVPPAPPAATPTASL